MKKSSRRTFLAILIAIVLAPIYSVASAVDIPMSASGNYVANQIIVGYRNAASPNDLAVVRAQAHKDLAAKSAFPLSSLARDTELIELGQGVTVRDAISRLTGRAGIRFVEPNFVYTKTQVSNDPSFTNSAMWGMWGPSSSPSNAFGSNAAGAWANGSVGSQDVVIGVIDEGIQITHPDLRSNIWSNPGEIVGDGIDNDNNGLIDDINGWDFVSNDNSVYDGSADDHGTHVAGTIGAQGGNGLGVAGVNWNVKIISTKFLGANGGTTANAVRALDYLTNLKVNKGINIVATSNSWGGGGLSSALLDAINRSGDAGMLFIAAAGNASSNIDATPSYPASYQCVTASRSWDCLISVASITSTGGISSFSNYGLRGVDLGAPGSGILSTIPSDGYAIYSGTSMATPHVSGAAALCKSIKPGITGAEIRNAILSSVVATSSLNGLTVTGGRLNIGDMALACASSTSKLNQSSLTISNTPTSFINPSATVGLTTSGGSGNGTLSFTTTSANCRIAGADLSLINNLLPVNCSVVATKAGDDTYNSISSVPAIFNFVGNQSQLVITTPAGTYPKGGNGVLLTTSGGNGSGAVTFTSTNPSVCVVRTDRLIVDRKVKVPVSCSVTAIKAASTNYYVSSQSAAVVISFN